MPAFFFLLEAISALAFVAAIALSLFAFEVGLRRGEDARLVGDREAVEGGVDLAVSAAVEAVALVFAAARVEGCNAGVAGELGVGAEAIDGADFAEQLGRCECGTAGQLEQARRDRHGLLA